MAATRAATRADFLSECLSIAVRSRDNESSSGLVPHIEASPRRRLSPTNNYNEPLIPTGTAAGTGSRSVARPLGGVWYYDSLIPEETEHDGDTVASSNSRAILPSPPQTNASRGVPKGRANTPRPPNNWKHRDSLDLSRRRLSPVDSGCSSKDTTKCTNPRNVQPVRPPTPRPDSQTLGGLDRSVLTSPQAGAREQLDILVCAGCGGLIAGNFFYPIVGPSARPAARPVCQSCSVNGRLSRALAQIEKFSLEEQLAAAWRTDLATAAASAALRRRRHVKCENSDTASLSMEASLTQISRETQDGKPTAGPSSRTCTACDDEVPAGSLSTSRLTSACTHETTACVACIQQWIDTQLENQGWDQIQCIECTENMQYDDVRRHATPIVFARYDRLAARAALSSEPDFIWCQGPGCDSGQIHEGGEDTPLFQCRACGFRYCVVHTERWHEGETCSEFDARMDSGATVNRGNVDTQDTVRTAATSTSINSRRSRLRPPRNTSTDDIQQANDYAIALHMSQGHDHGLGSQSDRESNESLGSILNDASSFRSTRSSKGRRIVRKLIKQANNTKSRSSLKALMALQQVRHEATAHLPQIPQLRYGQNGESRRKLGLGHERAQGDLLEQSKLDATIAKALQRQFEKEEKERVRQVKERERKERDKREAAERERLAYKRRIAEEELGEQTVRSISKACPKCRYHIQKSGGCEHMTCSKCRHEFCWSCLADYKNIRNQDNSAHNPGCTFYRR